MPAECNKKRFPLVFKLFYLFFLLSSLVYLGYSVSAKLADKVNETVGTVLRRDFAALTAWIPFSVAEWMLLTLPVLALVLIAVGAKKYCKSWRDTWIFIGSLFSVFALVLSLFVWTLAPGNFGTKLEDKLDLDRKESSASDLAQTALILSDHIKNLCGEITFLENGFSVMSCSVSELSDKLVSAYDRFLSTYPIFQNFDSNVKPIMLSEPMSYTHITGIYTYFTGEANVNVDFPDYTIPFTAAHEMAHQRGISREDEANFVAFLVCISSEDPYIRYSGYLGTYEYVCNALFQADAQLYYSVFDQLPNEVRKEEIAYSAFFDKYEDSTASKVTESVNDHYLKSQGSEEGTKTYNLVVDLAVSYCRPNFGSE